MLIVDILHSVVACCSVHLCRLADRRPSWRQSWSAREHHLDNQLPSVLSPVVRCTSDPAHDSAHGRRALTDESFLRIDSIDRSFLAVNCTDRSLLGARRGYRDQLVKRKHVGLHIKKPLNAFMLFMKEMRSKVVDECTLKESAAINQILGRKVYTRLQGVPNSFNTLNQFAPFI